MPPIAAASSPATSASVTPRSKRLCRRPSASSLAPATIVTLAPGFAQAPRQSEAIKARAATRTPTRRPSRRVETGTAGTPTAHPVCGVGRRHVDERAGRRRGDDTAGDDVALRPGDPGFAQVEVPAEARPRDDLQRHAEPGGDRAQEFDVEAGPIGIAGDERRCAGGHADPQRTRAADLVKRRVGRQELDRDEESGREAEAEPVDPQSAQRAQDVRPSRSRAARARRTERHRNEDRRAERAGRTGCSG